MAYKAKERDDLLAGIDEFLDQVTVLPPGEWDPSIRIEPPKNVPSQVMNAYKIVVAAVGAPESQSRSNKLIHSSIGPLRCAGKDRGEREGPHGSLSDRTGPELLCVLG